MRRRAGMVLVGLMVLSGLSAWAIAREAAAATPVAIVEDAFSHEPGLAAYDLLREGQTIDLPAGVSLTIGYFESCSREVIRGMSELEPGRIKLDEERP